MNLSKVAILDKTFNRQMSEKKRNSAVKWASLNICCLSAVYYDLRHSEKAFDENEFQWIYVAECFSCIVLTLSLITNVCTFIYHSFTDKIVCDNEAQKVLLNLNNSTVKAPPPQPMNPVSTANETFNLRNLSFQSYNDPNPNPNSSWNMSGHQNSAFSVSPDGSFNEVNNFQTPPKFNNAEFIMNKNAMDNFLKGVSEQEKDIASAIEAQNNISGYVSSNFSFWGRDFHFDEFIASLKTSIYQLSPHTHKQNPRDESYSHKDQENNSEIIRTISANRLSNYTANLKMWISKTILEPLVQAIDETDKAFQQRGFTDMSIGCVGLERLKKMSSTNQHLISNIPMLPKLIPFLELTTNQEYLVTRIRELAKGSCMKNYKFNVVSFNQPEADPPSVPSDAGIIFHLFCTYLDSQLHPLPDIPRAFYSRYVFPVGDVKKMSVEHVLKEIAMNKGKCGILVSNPITPKFNFISDKVHTSSYDRNNLFYVIIQFLKHLKNEGSLEGVNLGKSGINILNIIAD